MMRRSQRLAALRGIEAAPRLAITIHLLVIAISASHVGLADDWFRDKVAPIFQKRCLSCHDDVQREGSFSLQQKANLIEDGYVMPGDPDASHLLQVITPKDGVAEMPKDGDPLSEEERDAIAKWISSGANWPNAYRIERARIKDFDWWSFRPIRRPTVPNADVSDDRPKTATAFPIRSPIDAFVLQKWRAEGLSHSEPADRRSLLRRVTYDLIGLPPTPAEVEAFVNDADPLAYEKRIDALLGSKHYGERWARHWLDVVKYADTCGYDKDKLRPSAWPYRDYVIRSFNEDKRYATFVQEQVAGDVLFSGQPDGILGLGFLAAGPWDFIGHVEVPETKMDGKVARNLDRDDMVSNTLNTFCSLTVQCARCHHHKFDPITQENYYGLQAIFAAVDRAERPYDLDPKIEQQRRELDSEISRRELELKEIDREIAEAGGERLKEAIKLVENLQARAQLQKDERFGYHSQIVANPESEKWVQVDLGQAHELSRIVLHPCHDDYAQIGAGFGFPVRYRVEISQNGQDWKTVADRTANDIDNPGLAEVAVSLPQQAVSSPTQPARHIRVIATKLAERKADYIFALAELEAIGIDGTNLAIGKPVTSKDSIEAPARWGRSNLTDGKWASYSEPDLAQQLVEARQKRNEIVEEIETPERLDRRTTATTNLDQSRAKLNALPSGKMIYAAATQFKPRGNFKPTGGKLRPIHVLHRGEISKPGDPAIPGMLPLVTDVAWQLDPDTSERDRRAALARWLTDPDHPLVWRSLVNRIWQYHFGEGIVATPNDFGRMGSQPTFPQLLDWLAIEFRDGGDWMSPQSIKSLHRLIVTSSVYRQSSSHDPDKAGLDGNNRFLWRMNRRRLEAEEIRDSILAISGSLSDEMGGPGFQLFELERTEHSPHYEYHKFDPSDPTTHRRSIYRFIVRSQPDPWMTTLDCADSSQSTPRRTETLTSLQALSLLNSEFNLVMAEAFAERLRNEREDLHEQVKLGFELVTQRHPENEQCNEMVRYAGQHGLPNLCRILFNLSEFMYLD